MFHSLQSKDRLNGDDELNSDDYNENDDEYDEDDEDDEGTIHPIGPNTNPNTLLHSLTQMENERSEQNANHRKPTPNASDKTNYVKSSSSNFPIERLDGGSDLQALIPGPPRDLVAQLVNRYVTLSWMEPAKNPDEVVSYTVFYKMSSSDR